MPRPATMIAALCAAACVVDAEAAAQSCEPTPERPGLCNPLGELPAQPLLRDDEAIVVGFEGGMQSFAVQDSQGEEPGLSVIGEREGGEPLVAKGGAVLGVPIEQLVLISQASDGLRLELLSLGCVSGLPCPLVLGQYDFEPSNPSSEVALDIADVVEEQPGREVVLAYETQSSGEARMHLVVLSFSGAQAIVDESYDGPVEPTVLADVVIDYEHESEDGSFNLGLLRQQEGGANFFRALGMRYRSDEPPVILVAHATPDSRLALLALSVEALMDESTESVIELDAFELSEATADAGSWDVAVGRFGRLAGDGVFLTRQIDASSLDVRALRFERPSSARCHIDDGDICDSGPRVGMPCTSHDECPNPSDTLLEHAQPYTQWLCFEGPNCPAIELLNGRLHSTLAPVAPPFHWTQDLQLVLTVQSARGPLVQTFTLVGGEPFRIEPTDVNAFAWPRGGTAIDARPTFDAPAAIDVLVAHVIHRRATANRYGQGLGTDTFGFSHFDRAPSYYVSLPDTEPWSSMGRMLRVRPTAATNDGEAETGTHCVGVACELRIASQGSAIDAAPKAVLATADIDGDSGYFLVRASDSSANPNEFDLYLGPPLQITLHDLTAPEIILEEPPKHVDYLRDSNGGRVHNVSQSPEFSIAYRNATTESVQVQRESKVSYAFGESTETAASAKMSVSIVIFSASLEVELTERMSRDLEMSESAIELESSSSTLTQTFETSNDDQLFVVQRTVDIWRYPVIGLENELGAETARHPFVDLVVPGKGARSAHSGRNHAHYNPSHINGNVLSYPRFGDVSDVSDTAGAELQPFSVGGDCTNTLCVGGPNDGLACTEILECAAPEPLDTPLWAESSFDVSADTTTTLLLSNTESLGNSVAYSDTISESTSFSSSAELGFSYVGIGGSISGSYDYTVNEKHTFASSELTTNATSSENEIALKAPPLGAPEETYSFAPAFYFERTGAVKVSHHVQLPTGAASFWSLNYDAPDPALHLPYRIVCADTDCRLNDGPGRYAMKGLRILLAADDERDRHIVTSTPKAGTKLLLQAQVWNLSVGASTGELTVRFEVTPEGDEDSVALEGRVLIGDAVIDELGPGDRTVASIEWDTTDFGDPEGETLEYRIWVTLDPEDAIEDETHEWLDRDDDPLLDEGGAALDLRVSPATGEDTYLEKGQNNEGWGSIALGPSDETCATLPDGCPDDEDDDNDSSLDEDDPSRDGSVPTDRGDGAVAHDAGADAGDDRSGGGGCGCSVPGRAPVRATMQTTQAWLLALALCLSWVRKRRKRGKRAQPARESR